MFDGKEKNLKPLLAENGVHKVQRISKTSSKDKMHTSTASVAIMPIIGNNDIKINNNDIEITNFKGSGPGGQHRNKTESGVRVRHIPTGIIVTCSNGRSQYQNKITVMEILLSKLYSIAKNINQNKENSNRKVQIGTGNREEARRTYNYIRNEVTDNISGKKCTLKDIINKVNLDLLQ